MNPQDAPPREDEETQEYDPTQHEETGSGAYDEIAELYDMDADLVESNIY